MKDDVDKLARRTLAEMMKTTAKHTEHRDRNIELVKVRPSQLTIDLSYQRDPIKRLGVLRKIADDFDLRRIGVLHIHQRPSGETVILDGAGRWYVMGQLVKMDPEIDAISHLHIKNVKEEAEWFLKLNPDTLKKVTPAQKFKARIAAKDRVAIDINEAAVAGGLVVGGSGSNGINVQSAESLHHLGVLTTVGNLKRQVWPKKKVKPRLYTAVGAVLVAGDDLKWKRLTHILEAHPPVSLEADLRDLGVDFPHGRNRPPALAEIIFGHYNRRLGEGRVEPEWHKVDDLMQGEPWKDRWGWLKDEITNKKSKKKR